MVHISCTLKTILGKNPHLFPICLNPFYGPVFLSFGMKFKLPHSKSAKQAKTTPYQQKAHKHNCRLECLLCSGHLHTFPIFGLCQTGIHRLRYMVTWTRGHLSDPSSFSFKFGKWPAWWPCIIRASLGLCYGPNIWLVNWFRFGSYCVMCKVLWQNQGYQGIANKRTHMYVAKYAFLLSQLEFLFPWCASTFNTIFLIGSIYISDINCHKNWN